MRSGGSARRHSGRFGGYAPAALSLRAPPPPARLTGTQERAVNPAVLQQHTSLACGERSAGVLASAAPALAAASAFIFFRRVRAAARGTREAWRRCAQAARPRGQRTAKRPVGTSRRTSQLLPVIARRVVQE